MGLDNKNVGAADTVAVTGVNLSVGKGAGFRGDKLDADFGGNLQSKLRVRSATDQHEILLGGDRNTGHDRFAFFSGASTPRRTIS